MCISIEINCGKFEIYCFCINYMAPGSVGISGEHLSTAYCTPHYLVPLLMSLGSLSRIISIYHGLWISEFKIDVADGGLADIA